MTHETAKAVFRRGFDRRYTRYLAGAGIDIGAGDDSLSHYQELFPLMRSCRAWDLPDGDANLMEGVADNTFDFVHSSHCLEHLERPDDALFHWIRICKPGGYLLITVPDEELYEQGVWPSTWAGDGHKWSFTIARREKLLARSLNLIDLLGEFVDRVAILRIELLDAGYLYGAGRFDQTRTGIGECAIEVVLRKNG